MSTVNSRDWAWPCKPGGGFVKLGANQYKSLCLAGVNTSASANNTCKPH